MSKKCPRNSRHFTQKTIIHLKKKSPLKSKLEFVLGKEMYVFLSSESFFSSSPSQEQSKAQTRRATLGSS